MQGRRLVTKSGAGPSSVERREALWQRARHWLDQGKVGRRTDDCRQLAGKLSDRCAYPRADIDGAASRLLAGQQEGLDDIVEQDIVDSIAATLLHKDRAAGQELPCERVNHSARKAGAIE